MGVIIEVKTDHRVKELISVLSKIEDIKFLGEIDSLNYGEGFDFQLMNIGIRVYDDDRFDLVLSDQKYRGKIESYEKVFERIVASRIGKTVIRIEIDRGDLKFDLQNEVVLLVKKQLTASGYRIV